MCKQATVLQMMTKLAGFLMSGEDSAWQASCLMFTGATCVTWVGRAHASAAVAYGELHDAVRRQKGDDLRTHDSHGRHGSQTLVCC